MKGDGPGRVNRQVATCLLLAAATAAFTSWPTRTMAAADGVEDLVGAVCQGCHMIDGNSVVPMFPKLAGQQSHYLESQLEAWLEGRRRIEVMDAIRGQVRSRDVAALAGYFAAKTPVPGVVEDATLAEAGQQVYLDGNEESGVPACEACHQWDGEGNDLYPRLAGQHPAYTVKALQDFRSSARTSDRRGIMNKIAGRMTDEEIAAVAQHIAGLSGGDQESP